MALTNKDVSEKVNSLLPNFKLSSSLSSYSSSNIY